MRPCDTPDIAPSGHREARWFIVGDIDDELRPLGRPKCRVDSYELTTMRPWHAIKLRDGSAVERKSRVGRVEMVHLAGVIGFAERWIKVRRGSWRTPAVWIEVAKRCWRDGSVEVTSLANGAEHGWSLCLDLTEPLPPAALATFERWAETLRARGVAASYPAWLGNRFGRELVDLRPERHQAV